MGKWTLKDIADSALSSSNAFAEIERIISTIKILPKDHADEAGILAVENKINEIFLAAANSLIEIFKSEVLDIERVDLMLAQFTQIWATMFSTVLTKYPSIANFFKKRTETFLNNNYGTFHKLLVQTCLDTLVDIPESEIHRKIIDGLGVICPHVVMKITDYYIKEKGLKTEEKK